MPTSPWSNIPAIFEIVMTLHPRPCRVLDVGIGYGKFGFLCKEYIGFWNSPDKRQPVSVDGIEAFPSYVSCLQREIYDQIFIGDAREILPQLSGDSYDLVILIDVLEHFERADAVRVLAECQRVGKVVVVSTPRRFWPQQASWGNPFECHRSLWRRTDLLSLGAVHVRKGENWIGVFARPPYRERFTLAHRVWQRTHDWVPDWLQPCARWAMRSLSQSQGDA
jgi:SAM-dependent methyltransferase